MTPRLLTAADAALGAALALAIIAAGIAAYAYRWGLLPVADLGDLLRDGGRR